MASIERRLLRLKEQYESAVAEGQKIEGALQQTTIDLKNEFGITPKQLKARIRRIRKQIARHKKALRLELDRLEKGLEDGEQ